MIYVEIEDIKDHTIVFKGTNKEAVNFLDVSLPTLSNAVSNQRLIRKRYRIVTYQSINNKIGNAMLNNIFNDYCDGFTLQELQEKYDYNCRAILENLKRIPSFESFYSHYTIDSYLKEQIKEQYGKSSIEDLCRKLRVTRKQVEAVISENPMPLFEKVSRGNILRRAFNQNKNPKIVCERIMNTSRFKLWSMDKEELKREVYEYYEREINQYL